MRKHEIKLIVPIPEFLWIKKQYCKACNLYDRVYRLAFWCKYTKHWWKERSYTQFGPHWRICRRCGERELDHKDGIGTPDWHPTTYGTPEWDRIKFE